MSERCGPCDGDCTPCEMHGFCHLCEVEATRAQLATEREARERLLDAIRRAMSALDLDKGYVIGDRVCNAYAILQAAHMMHAPPKETADD